MAARRWFRFGKKDEEAAPETVAALEAPGPPEVQPEVPAPEEATDPAKRRRRRGSRGGRGKKKARPEGAVEPSLEGSTVAEKAAKEPARGRPERKQERRSTETRGKKPGAGTRRRTATRRAPLPAAKRELLISVDVGEQRVAILEDDRVAEVYLERPERRSIAGNIYLGVVDNVLPGMEAAFVEIGLEKNGFLYVDEIVGPELEGRKGAKKIQDLIRRGETVLVQAVKDPMKSKGARLTTEISLPGRFLVYVPNGEGYGVSRRLDDPERNRLKEIVKALDAKEGGIIVRTAAEGASAEDVERDLVFLQRLWKTIQTNGKGATAPSLVYEEAELPLRIVRDLFAGDFLGAQIDDDRTYRRIVSYLKKTSPHMIERVHRYRDKAPLFESSGVEAEIRSTLERRVSLPSGGYLVFDYAEAFTVIDVNTGRFVGSRGKAAGGRLEDTIVKNNLEAVKEVVHQLRLRDIGGIIVIDFIDMSNPKNRETVEEALRTELERDRTKTYVVEISPLGLVEMTRQNVTDGPREILTRKCPVCAGDGFVVSDETVAIEVERKLRELAPGSRAQAFRVAVHPRILSLLAGAGGSRLAAIEAAARRRFFLVPAENGHIHLDHLEVLEQGKLDAIRPSAPVEEGQTVELKLVEVGLHDVAAGVGKLDGYDIVVAGAAKLVGKKVKVTVGHVLDGVAFVTLADSAKPGARITFEAEAEKPTRAPSRKKTAAAAPDDRELEVADDEPDEEAAELAAEETVIPIDEDDVAPDAPKKKRTRRGTRGGKSRKKTPTASVVAPDPDVDGGTPTPTIHLPPADLGIEPAPAAELEQAPETEHEREGEGDATEVDATTDGQPKKKRTRRGTRGGRRRRKPTANGEQPLASDSDGSAALLEDLQGEASDEPAETAAPAEKLPDATAEAPAEAYVPMSEWIEDFDSRTRAPRGQAPRV
ncbi:MAG: Rne/Rng family ribonuclease [Actinobacteria bacterium]|nr:Rne/Rng family ribonuclease [Actinomycetota bacterium]